LPLELAAYSWSDRDEGYAKKVKKVLDTLGGGLYTMYRVV